MAKYEASNQFAEILIVGNIGGTNVGESLARAGRDLGYRVAIEKSADAMSRLRIIQSLFWRLGGRRPVYLEQFSKTVVSSCVNLHVRFMITTGTAPISRSSLERLRKMGVICINYSTDDPWNPVHRAEWFHRALRCYDLVFTTRRSNIDNFRAVGCKDVRFLPFAYDPHFLHEAVSLPPQKSGPDVLFVGGADTDRLSFLRSFLAADGPALSLVGGYWDRYREMRPRWLGHLSPQNVAALTQKAKVNIILVRRANRDGHVMRSFEAGALGGCLVVEKTDEHLEVFGADHESVRFFETPEDAAIICQELLDDPEQRSRLSAAVKDKVRKGKNTYADRLQAMLSAAEELARSVRNAN